MRKNLISAVAAAAVLAAASTPAQTVAAPAGVQTLQAPTGVEYISGGVGEEQRAGMRAVSDNYNLKIVTALESGSYLSDAQVTVTDATSGKGMLSTRSNGPLLYTNVPEGRYKVTASAAGQAQTREVRVGSGLSPEVTFKFRAPAKVAAAPVARTPAMRMPSAGERQLTRAELDGHVSVYNLEPGAPAPVAAPAAAAPTMVAQGHNPQPTRAETEGHISLYNLDPAAADRARAEVNVYEVYPDGTERRVDPGTVRTMPMQPAPAETDAVIINIEPAAPAPAMVPPVR